MNAWLVAAIVALVLFLTSCKCTCMWWDKKGPMDQVDLDHCADTFSDYVYSDFNADPKAVDPLAEAAMCPCGYKKGPVVYKRNSRERKMPDAA
jgi:hypothetical protein